MASKMIMERDRYNEAKKEKYREIFDTFNNNYLFFR